MRVEDLDFAQNAQTLWAVVLGAVLATISGIVATQLEGHFGRRAREREAALLFGEVLQTLGVLLNFADEARGRGEPFGPVTMRMLSSARREIDIYDRNREALYFMRDGNLRVRIHSVFVRIAMPLDGVFDYTNEIASLRLEARTPGTTADHREELEGRIGYLKETQSQGFDFVMATAQRIPPIIAEIGRLTRHSFDGHEDTLRRG